jgi:hypothetical protein
MNQAEVDIRTVKCRDCYRSRKSNLYKQGSCDWKDDMDMNRVKGCSDGVDVILVLEYLKAKADQCQANADETRARVRDRPIHSTKVMKAILAYIEMQEAQARAFEAEARVIELKGVSTRQSP